MPRQPKFRICSSTVIVAFAALLVGLLDGPVAHAQEDDRDFVDVGLILEVPRDLQATTGHDMDVIVVNNGTRTAYDVEVTVYVVSPDQSRFVDDPLRGVLIAPVGQASVAETSVVWTIPELGPLQREVLTPRVVFKISGNYDNSLDPHEISGKVTTASFESDRHKGNNTARVWSFQYQTRNNLWIQAAVDYSVDVSVDNWQPSPGDTVNFTITAGRKTRHIGLARIPPPIDLKVDIELTGGLSHTGSPSYYATYLGPDPVSTTYSPIFQNDELTIGTGKATDISDSDYVTLPVQVASDAVVNEQCLTARLTGNPPPGNGRLDDAIANNVAKLCLGEAERFTSGQVDAFIIYPCVGNTNSPCDSTDDVRVRAVDKTAKFAKILASGQALVHVPDRPNRKYDSHDNSVNAGTKVSWPIDVTWSAANVNTVHAQWNNLRDGFTASGTDGGSPPGRVHIRAFEDDASEIIYTMTPDTTPPWVFEDTLGYNPGALGNGPFEYVAEFEKLGTYKIEFTVKLTRATIDGDENCDPSNSVNQRFCATETYIFHVGPITDLGVIDGRASPHVAADRNALTIIVVNNGPEQSPGAKVTGLPTGADVIHVSQGAYNSTSGEWDIGVLRPRSYYRSRGEPEPTLVLSAAAGDTASVSIAAEDYEVCIGSDASTLTHTAQAACEADTTNGGSWHEGTVYDHNAANNTATVTATAGAGVSESVPTSVAVIGTDTAGVFVKWEPVAQVNGLYVTHYELQRMDSSWTTVAPKVTETIYLDKSPGSDNPDYRVRAVNAAGVPGLWSQTSGRRPGVPQDFTATVAASGTQINLAWSAPADVPGVTVSGYDLEVSSDGGDNWTTLASEQSAVSYDHTDSTLAPGATREYRVRTVGMVGGKKLKSAWATTTATVVYPKPGVPKSFTASGSSDARATLRWSAPDAVADVTVTGYDLEFSKDGGNTWVLLTEGITALTFPHTDNTLGADAVRQYRLRTVGTVGSGSERVTVKSDWAFAVATRDYPTPGAPRNFTARAINQSRVDLSWSEPEAVTGVRVTGYHLDFSTDGNEWKWLPPGQSRTVLSATTESHSHTDDTLPAGAIRQYRLRAVGTDANNAVFESGWVFASVATEEVGAPLDLTAAADGRNRIDLTWKRPAFGADAVTGYRIDHTPESPEQWRTLEHNYRTSPRSYQHGGLLPGERHCYRVAAIYAGGTGPFAARACATTEGAPEDLPGEPENLRIAQAGSNYVELEWDAPSVGGAVEYYEYQSNIHTPVEVSPRTATRMRVGGLQPGSSYSFQVRAGNSYGPGAWSQPIQVNLHRAGEAVKASPLDLELDKGSSGSFNVRLNRSPQWPLRVYFVWDGPKCLTELLPYQQGKILLPTNPPPSKEFWDDFWWGPPEDRFAVPWNVGHDIEMDASGCQGGETAVVGYDVWTVPFSDLEGLSLWEVWNLNEDEWREKWGTDPLDGASGPSVKVTVSDGGVSGQQSSTGAAGEPTAVTLALDAATVSESVGQVTITATLNAPAPEGGIGGFLFAGEDGTASEDIDFTMPLDIFIPGGQRSATATISITDDDLDEADETVVLSALFDIGTALLEDKITLTITDDDTAGVTVTAANPVNIAEGGTATYTVVLDSQPTADVTIAASSDDTSAATVSPASHTIQPSGWNTPATFTVNGVADADSNDETVGVTHRVSSQDPKYDNLPAATVRVEVSDTTAPGQQGQDPSNRAPTVANGIGDATITNESGTLQVSLSGVFSDADNDSLTVTAASNDEAVATVSVAAGYSALTVAAKARGTATITVTAADGNGGTVSDAFTVKVKAAPVVASALADVSGLEAGATQDVSLSGVFSDADNDSLTVTAASNNDAVATVSVASDGSTLTVTGVAEGTATITVTARDADGNRVSDAFDVSVAAQQQQQQQQDPPPNQAPTVSAAIGDATIVHESGTHEVSLSGVFSDADNDALTITAASNDEAVATVSVAAGYSSLTVAAKSRGTATITVTANDGNGGTVDDTFTATVKAAPVVASPISDVSGLIAGDARDVSLSGVFSDADGDSLTVTAASSDDAKATVSVASDGSKLTLGGVAEGTATITVTAQDSDGNRVSDDFEVSVQPKPEEEEPERETSDGSPTVVSPLPDISLERLQWRQYSLPDVFHDPDGDELTFHAESSNYDVASAWVSEGSTLTVLGTGTGTATITVTAKDPGGNQVSDEFQVTVGPLSAVFEYSRYTVPFSELQGLLMWDELALNEEEWREKWGVDPLDGISAPSVMVTVPDGGASRATAGEQSLTNVNVSAVLPLQAAVWRREEWALYGFPPAWYWWDWWD